MQLMAGVKLCTGRPITNHPHFEDQDLRLRTKEVKLQKWAQNINCRRQRIKEQDKINLRVVCTLQRHNTENSK